MASPRRVPIDRAMRNATTISATAGWWIKSGTRTNPIKEMRVMIVTEMKEYSQTVLMSRIEFPEFAREWSCGVGATIGLVDAEQIPATCMYSNDEERVSMLLEVSGRLGESPC